MRSITVVGVGEALTGVQEAVAGLVDAVRAGGLAGLGHEELSGLLREARSVQARVEFVGLAAVREVEVRGSFVADGALSVAAWARQQARLSPWEAAGVVRTARVLGSGRLPQTAAALAAGEVDPAVVRMIAAAVADAPAGAVGLIEGQAVAVARQADPRAVAAVMARFRHALDPEAADRAALAGYERRGLTLSPLPDGLVAIRGLADEVTGSVLMTALQTAGGPPVAGDRRTAAQRRLDAAGDLARAFLGAPAGPGSGAAHPHVIVTLDEHTLTGPEEASTNGADPERSDPDRSDHDESRRDGWGLGDAVAQAGEPGLLDDPQVPAADGGPVGTLSWVGPIAGSTARRVACDAQVTMVLIDRHGRVRAERQDRRFFTPAQRAAMIARDGDRCVVPWCDRPVAWSDGHHLRGWARGGPTTVANGALPCGAHHTLLHEGGWTLERLPDGRYRMRHRDGKIIGPEPHPPGHNRPPPPSKV